MKVEVEHQDQSYEVEISRFNETKSIAYISNIWNMGTGESVIDKWFERGIIHRFESEILNDLRDDQINDFLNDFLK